MKNIYFDSNAHRSSAPMNGGWTCSSYGNGSNGICINNDTGLGFSYVCSGIGASQGKIWNQCKMDTPYLGSEKILGTTISYTDLTVPKPPFPIQSQTSFGFKPLGFTSSRSVVNESPPPEFSLPYFSTPTVGFSILGQGLVFGNPNGKSRSERTTEFVSNFLETSKARAQRLKDNAITKSDHITADIFTEQAWAEDAEWHRVLAIKNNDHGEHGIEFRGKQLQGYYRNIARLLEELETEAQRVKDSAITPSEHLKADIIMNKFLLTMHEEMRVIALKKNDRTEQGVEFRSKKITESNQEIQRLTKALLGEADRIKGEAITPSDHLRAEIAMNEAWRTDTEWYRELAVKNNDHGEYGIEFRNKQLETHNSITFSKIKELRNETQKLKDSAVTPSDHLRADIAMNEAWRTDTEWYRELAVKNNDHGEYGIEFRNKQLETHDNITFSKLKELRSEAQKLKDNAVTPSDHLRADIAMNEAWRTDTEWYRELAVKNNDHGEYGIEFRNKQLETHNSITFSKIKDFVKNDSDVNLSGLNINDNVVKLLADSLTKGEMPNLKKLHLEGNKITDEGQDALINALKNETVQDVIITAMTLYEKYELNINGSADRKMSIYENRLEQAKARGVDVDNVVVERTTLGWIKNKIKFTMNLSVGWVKCMVTYDDAPTFVGERLLAKLSSRTSLANDAKDSLLCYFEAENDALQTEEGVKHTKYQMLDVITSPELTGNIEAWYDTLYH